MLNLEINSKGFVFSVDYNGTNIPVSQWSETDDCIYYLPLVALVDNGFVLKLKIVDKSIPMPIKETITIAIIIIGFFLSF